VTTRDEVQEALGWVSPDCGRDEWWRVLAAIKAALGESGQDVARDWSAGGASFEPGAFRDTWRSLRPDGGIGPASLFKAARDAGWKASASHPPSRAPQTPQAHVHVLRDLGGYARDIWARVNRDDAAVAGHPYARRKGIRHAAGAGRANVSGSRIGRDADCLVVPLRDLAQEVLLGVEVINAHGIKQTYGRKGCLILGNELDPSLPITVVEGWASAAVLVFNIFAGNACAIVAGGKGPMERTATAAASRWPGRVVVIAEEDDQ
jgi:hypothetical protein